MVLSPLRSAYLVPNCPDVDVCHISSSLVSPRPIVLTVDWNWSLFFCKAAVETDFLAAGVENAALVHDRQVVQRIELFPVVAAYVTWTMETRLCRAELERLWKLRSCLLDAAAPEFFCGSSCSFQMGGPASSPSDFNFPSWLPFGHRAGSRVWRVWNSVKTELRVAGALVAFAFHDARRPIDEMVCSTDASTGETYDSIIQHWWIWCYFSAVQTWSGLPHEESGQEVCPSSFSRGGFSLLLCVGGC